MKVANYRYLEFISSFDDHSKGNGNLTKVTSPVVENERSYRGLNSFSERDLQVLEAISREEYMTIGMQRKDIRKHLGDISPSAMSRIFKRLCLHGIMNNIYIPHLKWGLLTRSRKNDCDFQSGYTTGQD